ncbi:MAG: hypothetical protein J5J00_15805 [Deltaproteobacteria bacterium]|nr:hypothetical protein [Deltaproteobacteria bacterium]
MTRTKAKLTALLFIVAGLLAYIFFYAPGRGVRSRELDERFLSHLPPDTEGFFYFSLSSDSARRYIGHPAYKKYMDSYQETIKATPLHSLMTSYFDVLSELGFWPSGRGKFSPVLSDVLWMVLRSDDEKLELGVIGRSAKNEGAPQILAGVKAVLERDQFAVEEVNVPAGSAITFQILTSPPPPELAQDPSTAAFALYWSLLGHTRIYVGARGDLFVLTGSSELLAKLLSQSSNDGIAPILESPSYTAFKQRATKLPNDMGYGFINAERMLESLAKRYGAALPGPLPELPVKTFALCYGGEDMLEGELQVELYARNETQREWIEVLSGLHPYSAFDSLPPKAAFALSVSGELVRKAVKNAAPKGRSGEEALTELAPLLDSEEVSVAVRGASAGSMIPEVLATVKTKEAAALLTVIKRGVSSIVPGGADNNTLWKSQEIGGLSAEYMLTPFGAGIYLAQSNQAGLLLSTAPSGIEQLAALNGKESLYKSMSGEIRNKLESHTSAWLIIDYEELAALMESFKRSFMMFMPPDQLKNFDMMENMRYLGKIGIGASVTGGVLRIPMFQQFS